MTTPEKIEVPGGLTQYEFYKVLIHAQEQAILFGGTENKARAEYLQSLLSKEPK